jgi:hypothetical protein
MPRLIYGMIRWALIASLKSRFSERRSKTTKLCDRCKQIDFQYLFDPRKPVPPIHGCQLLTIDKLFEKKSDRYKAQDSVGLIALMECPRGDGLHPRLFSGSTQYENTTRE